jgi:hypothetical protein
MRMTQSAQNRVSCKKKLAFWLHIATGGRFRQPVQEIRSLTSCLARAESPLFRRLEARPAAITAQHLKAETYARHCGARGGKNDRGLITAAR